MNTVLLQYALEVEKTGSITQAANNLYMEQPNLSKAIRTLEDSIGGPIFKRTSKGVLPTQQGELFLKQAKKIMEQIEQMDTLYKTEETRSIEFKISIPRATYISEAFAEFVKTLDRKKGINLWIRETNSLETIEDVSTGNCHMGIIRYPMEFEKYYTQFLKENELHSMLLWEYEPVILLSEHHPLSEQNDVTYAELCGYTEILHGDINLSSAFSNIHGNGDCQNKIHIFERGNQINLLQTNHDTYMWVSPLSESSLKEYQLIQKPCRDMRRKYKDVFISQSGYRLTEYDEVFLKTVRDMQDKIIYEC